MTQLATNRIQLAEHMRNIWYVTSEHGTPLETLLDPKYWAHVSAKFKPRDRIEVDSEDGSYFIELMVMDAGRLYAKVEVLRKHEFKPVEVSAGHDDDFEVKWGGRHVKWRVIRKKDRAVLKDGLEDRSAGEVWLAGHAKAVAA
jgi:hypothetical protein